MLKRASLTIFGDDVAVVDGVINILKRHYIGVIQFSQYVDFVLKQTSTVMFHMPGLHNLNGHYF